MIQRFSKAWLFLGALLWGCGPCGAAFAATISGSITNTTRVTGSRVYLSISNQYGGDTSLGVSVPPPGGNGTGSYSIRGVPPGQYIVKAFLDSVVPSVASRHANDPVGASEPITISGADVSGVNITLAAPSPVPLPVPEVSQVIPGPGSAMIQWETPTDSLDNEIPVSYNVYWSSSPTFSSSNYTSLATGKQLGIPSGGTNTLFQTGLSDGDLLYYVVEAVAQDGTVMPSDVFGPVLVGAIASDETTTFSLSGTINIDPAIIPSGPLYIAAVNDSGPLITKIDSPTATNAFSITGLWPGTYQVYAFLDQAGTGIVGPGGFMVADRLAPTITVGSSDATGVTTLISKQDIDAYVATAHSRSASGAESYGLNFGVNADFRLPVNLAIPSGQDIAGPVDIAVNAGSLAYGFSGVARPKKPSETAQAYNLEVGYADGGSATVTVTVSDVIDSFATPISPIGGVAFNATPTFNWGVPAAPPAAGYSYGLSVTNPDYGTLWDSQPIPANQTAALYNFDGQASWAQLADATNYQWSVEVTDLNGNFSSQGASFYAGGSISGKISDGSGAGLAGIAVQPFDSVGNSLSGSYTAVTRADGTYTIGALASGTYRVCIATAQNGYLVHCYNNASSAETAANVAVVYGQNTPNINIALTKGGTLTGTVTGTGPLAGVVVQLDLADGTPAPAPNTATTDSLGNYTIAGIAAGTYKVDFDASATGYISQWNSGKPDAGSADPVAITNGQTLTVNASLTQAGGVSGTVTSSSGQPLAGATMTLYDSSGGLAGSATSDSNGTYSISGLVPGSYTMSFDGTASGYILQWYNGKPDQTSANPVIVTAGQVTAANASLSLGGSISGAVTAQTGGAALPGIKIEITDQAGQDLAAYPAVYTDSNGAFSVQGLPAGSYKVCFTDLNTGYVSQCYNSLSYNPPNATSILVAPPAAVTGINAVMVKGATISGKATSGATGVPMVLVQLRDSTGNELSSQIPTWTDASGNYTLSGVAPGGYTLYFNAAIAGYIDNWYSATAVSATQANATVVTVAAGDVKAGYNVTLSHGGTISGTVRDDSTSAGLSGIGILVFDGNGNFITGANSTNSNGGYSVPGLPDGNYAVCFSPGSTSYLGKCLGTSTLDRTNATLVTISGANTVSGKNIGLILGATITGTVTANNAAAPNVTVNLLDQSGNAVRFVNAATTDANGQYKILSIPGGGTYTVFFDGSSANFTSQWYSGQATLAQATLINNLTNGSVKSGVNATLQIAGSISGKVMEPAGQVFPGAQAQLTDSSGNVLTSTVTDSNGAYSFTFLAPGSYKLHYAADAGTAPQWYSGKGTAALADPVAVVSGANTALNNVVLKSVPTITWSFPSSVTTSTPIDDIYLNATASAPGTFQYSVPSGVLLGVGTQTLTATFTPTDSSTFASASKTISVTVVYPSGDINGDGKVDISDALLAMRIALGLVPMSQGYLIQGDMAPYTTGAPQPDGKITVGDALVILRKAVGAF